MLEGAGGGDDALGVDLAFRGLDPEPGGVGPALGLEHLDTGADRRAHHLGIFDKVVRDPVFRDELVRRVALELEVREAIVPGRTVGHERIPAPGPPGFGDPVLLQNQMGNAVFSKVFAQSDPGLATADNQRVNRLNGHVHILPILPLGATGGARGTSCSAFAPMCHVTRSGKERSASPLIRPRLTFPFRKKVSPKPTFARYEFLPLIVALSLGGRIRRQPCAHRYIPLSGDTTVQDFGC